MDLITLIETLESNLSREIVGTNYGGTVSYAASTPKTVTIDNDEFLQTNRLCLLVVNNITYLYVSSYGFKKTVKVAISGIESITIT